MLSMQISELDMLLSMFSGKGEIVFDDPSVTEHLRSLIECNSSNLDGQQKLQNIRFTLKLLSELKHSVEVVFVLPSDYPLVLPEVSVRTSQWSRTQHSRFTEALQAAVCDMHRAEEPCLYQIIQWIRDNIDIYITESLSQKTMLCTKETKNLNPSQSILFTRLWIYSHHIYNTTKRKTIIELARDLDLTGFSVAGKPGLICVEGKHGNVERFWADIRAMQWQRICVRHREDLPVMQNDSINTLRRFERFEEKSFEARQTKGHGAHSDLGLVNQFLQSKGFDEIFRMYFGIDGKDTQLTDKT